MLGHIVRKLEARVDALAIEMAPLFIGSLATAERRQAEHITYQLQNAWEIFVRDFVLTSATGRASGNAGPIPASVPRTHRSREAACHLLLPRPTSLEPKWHIPKEAIRAAQSLGIANLSNVSAAIGSTPWLLNDLRLTRNFFAHRSRSAALELRALNWFGPHEAISIETTLMPFGTGGVRRFDAWCASMKNVSQAML